MIPSTFYMPYLEYLLKSDKNMEYSFKGRLSICHLQNVLCNTSWNNKILCYSKTSLLWNNFYNMVIFITAFKRTSLRYAIEDIRIVKTNKLKKSNFRIASLVG